MQICQTSYQEKERSDEALLKSIAEGSVWAMEALYARYQHLFCSLAYRIVADHQTAEDLLQDTFLAVWRRANTYSPQAGSARTWLLSILHHRAIDHLRKLQRRSRIREGTLEEAEWDEKGAVADVWDDVWIDIQGSQVRAALLKIPPEQSLVLNLAYFQGWSHTEIARGTHAPLGTVKARLRLGLRHLRHILEQMGLDEAYKEG
ncbi:MAG TPA: sigma-70 family RNA polymerase sigma factor [Ktedonobacteraceae bacterium]|nr:sigma-70 family RNA polymerase sigma factor [Ktedonobacteraceae bacterium]